MKIHDEKCQCPYCGFVLSRDHPFCQPCQIEFVKCSQCDQVIRKGAATCPHCGAPRKENKNE